MPAERENIQQSDSPAPAADNHAESTALQTSPQESSDFNSRQRDDIKSNTSQMVENGTLPELSLHNTANNGSIGVEGGKQDNQSNQSDQSNQAGGLKDGVQDRSAVRPGEGPYNVAERLLGDNSNNSDVKALTGALRNQYRDETNNKDFMMANLKVGRELLTEKNADQVLGNIADPEARQRISDQLTKDSTKTDSSSAESSKPDQQETPKQNLQDPKSDTGLKGVPAKQDSKDEPITDSNDVSKTDSKQDSESAKDAKEETVETSEAKEGSVERSAFNEELSDPKVMAKFAGRMHTEVGSQGEAAQLAFAEEVMNRAAARDQTLTEALSGNYYPTDNPGKSNNSDYVDAITKAWKEGTDTIEGATGNASGRVGFGAGKARKNENGELVAPNQTVSIGGERFGFEQVDLDGGWMEEYLQLKKKD